MALPIRDLSSCSDGLENGDVALAFILFREILRYIPPVLYGGSTNQI